MKLVNVRALFRPMIECAVLLALAVGPVSGQNAPASNSESAHAHSGKRAAHLNHVAIQPVVIPQQESVAMAPLTPEELPAEPPHVTYENGRLTIDSQNSTLAAVLNAIGYQLAAQLDVPPGTANERVAVHLSGSARETIAALLDGSGLNYVIMGSPENPDAVQTVILTKMIPASGTRGQQPAIATAPPIPPLVAVTGGPQPTQVAVPQALPQPVAQIVEEPPIQPPSGVPAATSPAMAGGRQDMDCADLGLPPNCHQN